MSVNSSYKQHALAKVFSASSNNLRDFIASVCGVNDFDSFCAMV